MNLEESRLQIDKIDKELFDLFEKRLKLALDVAAYKKVHQMTIFRPEREQAILDSHAAAANPGHENYTRTFFHTCMECGKFYDAKYVKESDGIPRCECGGIIKPDVVLYEEGLDQTVIQGAVEAIASADTLIIGGTSLVVYPAAGFIDYFHGKHLVVINKSSTGRAVRAELSIAAPIGEIMSRIKVK